MDKEGETGKSDKEKICSNVRKETGKEDGEQQRLDGKTERADDY